MPLMGTMSTPVSSPPSGVHTTATYRWVPSRSAVIFTHLMMIHDNPNVQVITEDPTPDKVAEKLTGGVEDTLLLINMMKDLKMRELKKAKVSEIIAIILTCYSVTICYTNIKGAKNL